MVRLLACVVVLAGVLAGVLGGMGACSSNPPPRTMPQPLAQRSQQAQTPARAQDQAPAEQQAQGVRTAERPSDTPAAGSGSAEQAAAPVAAASAEPSWYRPGVFELEGVAHRAFAVTASDVREARSAAMRLAYDAYPRGQVAAHEAVLLGDGSWRFYVLMASGG